MSDKLVCPSWANFKATCVTQKNLNLQYQDSGDSYYIIGPDANDTSWTVSVPKLIPDPNNVGSFITNPDATDFLTNVAPTCNFAVGTRPYAFSTSDFEFKGDSVSVTVPKGTTANLNYKFTHTPGTYINGGQLLTSGAAIGDYIIANIVDIDNILGAGAGYVVNSYITKWFVDPASAMVIQTPYAAKVPGGLYLQIAYVSVGSSTDVFTALNLFLHYGI